MTSELGEAGFWILAALANGRMHGYGILAEVERSSEKRVTLRATSLYSALERLERIGWVSTDGQEIVDGRARRYYRLSSEGEGQLASELERLEAKADVARARLAGLRSATTFAVA